MKRPRGPWLVFGAALLVLVAVMTGVTARLSGLEQQRVTAERLGAHEEQVRLALWRLDSEVSPLLSQEIAAVAALAQAPAVALTLPRPPEVRARFVLEPDGALQLLSSGDDATAEALDRVLHGVDLWAAAPALAEGQGKLLDNPAASSDVLQAALDAGKPGGDFYGSEQQTYRNVNELSNRMKAVDDNLGNYSSSLATGSYGLDRGAAATTASGPARPLWIGDELILVRRVTTGSRPQLHGSWLDWPRLRERMLEPVRDALPSARLLPTRPGHPDVQHLLATLPVRLEPGPAPALELAPGLLTPSLALAWLGLVVAALAVFAVLRSALALSERRASFVSAVTHELRTPLTTFRMYAEMLEEGMVDEHKRSRYLATLRREADRLGDLVENVLAYARIESDRAPLTPETLTVGALVERVRERLEERSRSAGLELDVELEPELSRVAVRVDPAALEQILFNLVDNAAKYAPSGARSERPRLELRARAGGRGRVELGVRDHGPGIDPLEREAIFEPFAKARANAAGTQPGVGLGLALSRRLARQLGGDLHVEAAEPGARFVVSVPRARAARMIESGHA